MAWLQNIDVKFDITVDKTKHKLYTKKVANANATSIKYRGVEQLAARRAHNPKVVSSSLASATNLV